MASSVSLKNHGFYQRSMLLDFETLELDSEDDLLADEELKIAWRLDPDESWSDWTIKVRRKESQVTDTYFVHRTHLITGAETSNYFAALFRSAKNFTERDCTSNIELDEEAADAFPLFLDFIYTGQLSAHSKMISLHYLGSYFGNKSLEKMGRASVRKYLTVDNLQSCMPLLLKFPHEGLLTIARLRLLQFYLQSDHEGWDAPIYSQVDIIFFERLLEDWNFVVFSRAQWARTADPFISCVVAQYLEANFDSISQDQFLRLTDKRRMLVVDAKAALKLLDLELKFLGKETQSSGLMSCLQYRCLRALLNHQQIETSDETPRVLPFGIRNELKLVKHLSNALSLKSKDEHFFLQLESVRHRIRVSGSQLDGVDGLYYQVGSKNGANRYLKSTGKDEFGIERIEASWVLAKLHEGAAIHVFTFLCDDSDDHTDNVQIPPAFGWKPVQDVICSAPILYFEGDEVVINTDDWSDL